MLLTLRVTEERKRISSVAIHSVAIHRAPHIDIDRAVNHQDPPIADQFTTTPHAAASMRRLTGPTQSWLADGGF
jgi:hypothetical protein